MKADWCNIRVSVPWCSTGHFRDLRIWLLDNVQETDYEFKGLDNLDSERRIFYFARQPDAVLFSLTWT